MSIKPTYMGWRIYLYGPEMTRWLAGATSAVTCSLLCRHIKRIAQIPRQIPMHSSPNKNILWARTDPVAKMIPRVAN